MVSAAYWSGSASIVASLPSWLLIMLAPPTPEELGIGLAKSKGVKVSLPPEAASGISVG